MGFLHLAFFQLTFLTLCSQPQLAVSFTSAETPKMFWSQSGISPTS
ncbi:hypothetical protein Gotur_025483 [Gossypium turneri]